MTTPTPAPPRSHGHRGPTPDSHSFPTRDYDLVKEFVIALLVVVLLTVGLAAVFSSPDEKAISLRDWATAAPADVVATATGELAGTTTGATYGPPYNSNATGQTLGPLPLQKWAGVRLPVDSARDLVLTPLAGVSGNPRLAAALAVWRAADETQRTAWATAYADALAKAPDGDPAKVRPGAYGPVPVLADSFLALTRSGGLEGTLTSAGTFYGGDQTRTLLLLSDGALPRGPGAGAPPRRRPVGDDERDGQLPRTTVDVAVHVLVPDPPVLHLRERRRPGLGSDDGAEPRAAARAVHPRAALDTPVGSRAPSRLAGLLPPAPPPLMTVRSAHAGRHGAGAGQSQPGALSGLPSRVVTVRWQALGPWSATAAGRKDRVMNQSQSGRQGSASLFLATTGCLVTVDELLDNAHLAQIVAEDVAWRIALVQWESRRPHRWQVRRQQEWMTEYGELCRERERIVHIARFYGVPG